MATVHSLLLNPFLAGVPKRKDFVLFLWDVKKKGFTKKSLQKHCRLKTSSRAPCAFLKDEDYSVHRHQQEGQ